MEIIGYKAFNKDLTNRYGTKFEPGKIYTINDGNIQFGNQGNGFHLCKNMEDCFRYFSFKNENESIMISVRAFGDYHEFNDDYYGYYDMYAFENIEILKILTREYIVNYMLTLDSHALERFLMGYHQRILLLIKNHLYQLPQKPQLLG